MVNLYRGTSITQLAHNFKGDRFVCESSISQSHKNTKNLNLTPNLKDAILYAKKIEEDGLCIVLEFDVPEKILMDPKQVDLAKMQIQNDRDAIFAPSRNDVYHCYFIRSKYLRAIHEFKNDIASIEEFKERGRHLNIDGNKSKMKKYFGKRL